MHLEAGSKQIIYTIQTNKILHCLSVINIEDMCKRAVASV